MHYFFKKNQTSELTGMAVRSSLYYSASLAVGKQKSKDIFLVHVGSAALEVNFVAESCFVLCGASATRWDPFRGTWNPTVCPLDAVHCVPLPHVPREDKFNLKSKLYLRSLKHIKTS